MSEPQTAPDPLQVAADLEVEAAAAIARGELAPKVTPQETAEAEAEIDAAAGVTPDTPTPPSEPVASLGTADAGAETVREEPPPASPPAAVPRTDLTSDEKTWGTVAHAAAALTLIGVPFGNLLGPLVVWLAKKKSSPWVARHALAALNFQITMTLAFLVALASSLAVVGFVLAPAVVIADIVYTIKAAIKAGDCEEPSYPDWSLKLIKG